MNLIFVALPKFHRPVNIKVTVTRRHVSGDSGVRERHPGRNQPLDRGFLQASQFEQLKLNQRSQPTTGD